MFRALICPSLGAHDYNVDYHIGCLVLGLLLVGSYVRVGWSVSGLQVIARSLACSPDTTPACPHITSNQQQPKNGTANVVISTIVVSS